MQMPFARLFKNVLDQKQTQNSSSPFSAKAQASAERPLIAPKLEA